MFRLFFLFFTIICATHMYAQNECSQIGDENLVHLEIYQNVEKLELVKKNAIMQLFTNSDKRFDLSGIVEYEEAIYVVADKDWDNHLYKLNKEQHSFKVEAIQDFCINGKIDFEGIDKCGSSFYLIEESKSDVYRFSLNDCKLEKINIAWDKAGVDYSDWGNKGFEGLAVDCDNNILYLAKERQDRRVYKVDLNSGEITEPFKLLINSNEEGYDIADLKFENDALYILERGHGLVTKIDFKTGQKRSVCYQHIVLNNNQRLYENGNPKYGMAEALMLTENQIWIGLDNNGDKVSEYGKSIGLKEGKDPVILIFKRPEGF